MAKLPRWLKLLWWAVGICWVFDAFLWAHKWGWL